MHRLVATTAILTVLAFDAHAQTAENVRVGVIDLESETVPAAQLRVLSDRLREELVNTGEFQVLERERMDMILGEVGFQQSGCVATECAVEIGQLLGMEKMIGGRVGKVGDVYTITLRMVDVETGALERSAVRDCECALQDILTGVVAQVAAELAGLTWTMPQSVGAQPLAVGEGVGMLFVESTPAGGRIFINGRPSRESTPATLRNLPAGEHIVRVVREHLVAEERVRVLRDDLTKVSMPLQPGTGSLFIESEPPGADVRIDGTPRGTTPALIREMPAGPHTIGISADGYVSWSEDIVVEFNRRTEIPATLQPAGYVSLIVDPADANVWLDGREISRNERSRLLLAVGEHSIVARKAGHDSVAASVTVEPGRISTARLVLPDRVGSLVVHSTPSGASLSSSPPLLAGTTPYVNRQIEPGVYTIQLTLQNCMPWSETIEIGRVEARTLLARLEFTQEYLRRVQAERRTKRRRFGWASVGSALIAGGIALKYDADAQSAYDKASDAHTGYRDAMTTADAASWRAQIDEANSRGDSAVSKRNAMFGVAGGLLTLGVTLWVF